MSDEATGAAAPNFDATIASLKQKYDGRIAAFPVGRLGVWVVKYATGKQMRLHRQRYHLHEKNGNTEGIEQLVFDLCADCTVFPEDRASVQVIMDEYASLPTKVFDRIQQLSGGEVQELGKD